MATSVLKKKLQEAQLERQIATERALLGELTRLHADNLQAGRLAESGLVDPGNWVDPLIWRTDDWGNPLDAAWLGAGGQLGDRNRGKLRPFFETEEQLAEIRGRCRYLAGASDIGFGPLEKLTDYTIGEGFQLLVTPEPGFDASIADSARKIAEEFQDANDWQGDLDRELCRRCHRDGEVFAVLWPQAGGRAVVRVLEPEQISAPRDARKIEESLGLETGDWLFGIHTSLQDSQTVHGYHVQWSDSPADFDYLPALQVEHWKRNVDRHIKRGLSDFYPVVGWMEYADAVLNATGHSARIQAAIAWVEEMQTGTTQAQAAADRDNTTHLQRSVRTVGGGTTTHHLRDIPPGTSLRVHGKKYIPGPMANSSYAGNFLGVQQALLRRIGALWSMPEFMISGDASNANYASTLAAESPFTKATKARQHFYKTRFERLLWKVLKIAHEAGRFGLRPWSEVLASVRLEMKPPTVEVRDPSKETENRRVKHDAGILSKKTWAAEEGLDYEQEVENGAAPTAGGLSAISVSPSQSVRENIRQAIWESYP